VLRLAGKNRRTTMGGPITLPDPHWAVTHPLRFRSSGTILKRATTEAVSDRATDAHKPATDPFKKSLEQSVAYQVEQRHHPILAGRKAPIFTYAQMDPLPTPGHI